MEHVETREKYQQALETLIAKFQQDPYVLAVILVGSLSYDVVWDKSDIDLVIVTQEMKSKREAVSLVEAGVNIRASLVSRSEFRKMVEGSLQSSFVHSLLTKGQMLFSQDETLQELFTNREGLGERDRAIQLLRAATWVLPSLTKAEKWFHAKQDMDYCFLWIMKTVDSLATIETLWNQEIPTRAVVQQALRLNPTFFRAIYTHLIHRPKTPEALLNALESIRQYLRERADVLYAPVFAYLAEANGVRSVTEINDYFGKQANVACVDVACEWLADEDLIRKVSAPLRFTEKSRISVEETAYYYEGDMHS